MKARVLLPHDAPMIDYRKHMVARSEDVLVEGGPDGERGVPHRGIRWHMNAESYKRVMDMMACWNCLTGFPARPCSMNLGVWKSSGFNHVRPPAVASRLIREGRCPVCSVEISAEALGIQDEGDNPLNSRRDDDE